MRTAYKLGQKFLIDVQWKHFKTKSVCLYANPKDMPHPLTDADSITVIAGMQKKSKSRTETTSFVNI